jgi:hypothetical protein
MRKQGELKRKMLESLKGMGMRIASLSITS